MRKIVCSLIAMTCASAFGQTLPAANVSVDSLKKHIAFLASDSLKGRAVGTPEQVVAANYIASRFKSYGLAQVAKCPDYKQTFDMFQMQPNLSGRLKAESSLRTFRNFNDFIAASESPIEPSKFTPYDDPTNASVNNGILIIKANDLKNGLAAVSSNLATESDFILCLPTREFIKVLQNRMQLASMLSVSTASNGDKIFSSSMMKPFLAKGNAYYSLVLPFLNKNPKAKIIITDDFLVRKIIKKDEHVGEMISLDGDIAAESPSHISMSNVLGYVEGSQLKDEVVIVCGHYDHLTMLAKEGLPANEPNGDRIFNGADDNASGTATVIESSRLFGQYAAKGHTPKRSVMFVAFTGEELGLVGSDYMANSPLLSGKKIHAVINIDMVGRNANWMSDKDMYVYTLPMADSSMFDGIQAKAAKKAKIQLPATPENEKSKWTYGSDHYSFVQKGIPALAITTGEHPDYHTVRDEYNLINFPRLARIAEFVFYTAWEAAEM